MVKIKKIKEVTERSSAIMGRPKIANPKTEIGRVRLTESEMKKIKKSHKTFSAFVRAMIKTLPMAALVILASCGKGTPSTPKAPVSGHLYAIADINEKQSTLGYDLEFNCNDKLCNLEGEVHHFHGQTDNITTFIIRSGDLVEESNLVYSGKICNSNMQCYAIKFNQANGRILIKLPTQFNEKCTMTGTFTTQAGYDAFLASAAGLSRDMNLLISGKDICNF